MALQIGIAQSEDQRLRVQRLRYEVYIEEAGKRIPDADHQRRLLGDALDSRSALFFAEQDGDIVATARVTRGDRLVIGSTTDRLLSLSRFPRETVSVTSRLIVAPSFRCTRLLPRLLAALFDYARANNLLLNLCHCRPSLVRLYEHLGFRRYKSDVDDPISGKQVPLLLHLNDWRLR